MSVDFISIREKMKNTHSHSHTHRLTLTHSHSHSHTPSSLFLQYPELISQSKVLFSLGEEGELNPHPLQALGRVLLAMKGKFSADG